jgi:hypothetical protein
LVISNGTALLSFIVGATDTTRRPLLAPVGIVSVMDVPLHELIVTGASFKYTRLFPWEEPKPFPVSTTWLPMGPVEADTFVITGTGRAAELMDILSKFAVAKLVVEPLETASPMYVLCAIVMVWLVLVWTQSVPLADEYPLNVLPLLTNFIQ